MEFIIINGIAKLELIVEPQWNVYYDPSMDETNLKSLPRQSCRLY